MTKEIQVSVIMAVKSPRAGMSRSPGVRLRIVGEVLRGDGGKVHAKQEKKVSYGREKLAGFLGD